jgi:hypothetical protein
MLGMAFLIGADLAVWLTPWPAALDDRSGSPGTGLTLYRNAAEWRKWS